MKCPMNNGLPRAVFNFDEPTWAEDRACSYCGSMHPDDFMQAVRAGSPITTTDKRYKAYLNDYKKFYFGHLSGEQQEEFVNLYNAGKLKFTGDRGFYRLPFFMAPATIQGI